MNPCIDLDQLEITFELLFFSVALFSSIIGYFFGYFTRDKSHDLL